MSFEDFDQQINDAADKHHPEYREEAWGKMEQLLDEHLPQSKSRKKRAFLLLPLLLLLCTGGYFGIKQFTGKGTGAAILSEKAKPLSESETGNGKQGTEGSINTDLQNTNPQSAVPQTANNNNNEKPNTEPLTIIANDAQGNINVAKNRSTAKTGATQKIQRRRNGTNNNIEKSVAVNRPVKNKQLKPGKAEAATTITHLFDGMVMQDEEKITPPIYIEEEQPATKPGVEMVTPPAALNKNEPGDNRETAAAPKKETAKKNTKRNGFGNNFAITLSGGVDMSAVRFSEPGQKRIITGAGLQYQATKHLLVRAGIFKTNKVYAAQPQDYHSDYVDPSGSLLTGVKGDCRVFEIPVSIAYTFNAGKKLGIFAAAGASSIIMKQEDYVYDYKTAYGQYYKSSYGVKNNNEHLFSSIDISAGVEKQFSNRIFLRAEPYLRLPLRGVGIGQVKLKSAGMLLTYISFKPQRIIDGNNKIKE